MYNNITSLTEFFQNAFSDNATGLVLLLPVFAYDANPAFWCLTVQNEHLDSNP